MSTDLRVALCAAGEIWGGVDQFIESLSRYLIASHVPVLVMVLYDGPLLARLKEIGVPVVLIDGYGRYDPLRVIRMRRMLRKHRISVLHTHGYKAAVLGAIAARLSGVKHVRTEHGRIEPWTGSDRFKMTMNAYLERIASTWLTDAVVYVSRDVQRRSDTARSALRQTVIHNGIEPIDATVTASLPRGKNVRSAPFTIGIIGRIAPVKGHLSLLEAVRELRHMNDLRVLVLGSGPLEEECRRFCANTGLSEIVQFLGFQSNTQKYFADLDVLAMPSLHEGLPFTLLEAMYHEVPVVASAVGGLAEVIEDGVTGLLVPVGDTHALAAALERLHRDRVLRRQLASNARRAICGHFLVHHMGERYLAVYSSVVS